MSGYWLFLSGIMLGAALVGPTAFFYGKQYQGKKPPAVTPKPPEMDEMEAKAIDPNNPPTYQTYRPRSGVSTLKCTCHDAIVPPEAEVLLWPIPGHPEGGMDVFCERTYGQVGR